MANKFGARSVDYDGYRWFDSLKEERRYQELKLLERAGEIMSLGRSPGPIFCKNRSCIRGRRFSDNHTPDFRYIGARCNSVEGCQRWSGHPDRGVRYQRQRYSSFSIRLLILG